MVVGTVAVILICCIALFLDRYRSAMVQSAQTSSAQAVSQVSNTVGSYLSDMDQAMRLVEQSVSESGESRDRLLAAFLKFRPDVVAVTSYSADGELLDCWSPDREPKENILQNLSFDLDMARATGGSFMTAPHVETIFEGYYPWVVTMTAPLEGGGEAAWVSLDLSFSGISSYIKNVSIGQRGYCFLMDDAGNIIYHPQQQLLYAGLKSEDTEALAALEDGAYADDTVIYSVASVGESGWRAVGVSYVDELVNRNVNDMIRLSLWLAVVVLAVAVLTSWLLSRLIGKPLRGLASAMESFESDADHFTYRPVGGTREVQELSDSFEHMVLRIQELMTTVREEEVNLRKTELKALQAQINPHFLYNTLDSIAWMSEQGRNADAVKMVHALPHEHQPRPRAHTHRQGARARRELPPDPEVPLQEPVHLHLRRGPGLPGLLLQQDNPPAHHRELHQPRPGPHGGRGPHRRARPLRRGRHRVLRAGQRSRHEPGTAGGHHAARPHGPHRHRHQERQRQAEDILRPQLRAEHHQRAGRRHLRGDTHAQDSGGRL